MKKLSIQIMALYSVFGFASGVMAEDCKPAPDCADLGFTQNAADCSGAALKCPWNLTKAACKAGEEEVQPTVCYVGSILGSDHLCYSYVDELPDYVKPVGVVFDEANHLAVSLDQTQRTWVGYGKDVPTLRSCLDGLTCLTNGKQNTEAIINYGKANGVSYPAAEYCVAYKPSSVYKDETWYAAGAWFLPSVKELNTLYANKAAVNAALTKVNATTLGNEYYWSSTERSDDYVWSLYMSDGARYITGDSYNYYVRPVVKY